MARCCPECYEDGRLKGFTEGRIEGLRLGREEGRSPWIPPSVKPFSLPVLVALPGSISPSLPLPPDLRS